MTEDLLTPLENLRARGESIIQMKDGSRKRLVVRGPYTNPRIVTGGRVIPVLRVGDPETTSGGLPIEWEEA